jgi:archaellum biogenesis ATPase FlaH
VSNQRLELVILKNLLRNEAYSRKVLPYLEPQFFVDPNDNQLFKTITEFYDKYNSAPTYDALECEIDSLSIPDDSLKVIKKSLEEIKADTTVTTYKWLIDTTEAFCKKKAVYGAITNSLDILNGSSKTLKEDAIPEILKKALAISFDPNVGHDYLEHSDDRFDYYHRVEEKIPFDLDYFNRITKDGVSRGTLNVILAGTGVGKSLTLCHFASAALSLGKNVLYITLELSDYEVAKRIDANLMDTRIDDLMQMPKNIYDQRCGKIKAKTNGKLIIKQYPTASASVSNFRSLLNELNLKKNFIPDVIFIDYLNICTSARIKRANANSYEYIKSIAEEFRGLAVEAKVPLWTATQTNRSGFVSSDVGLEDTSESFGLPATADFMVAAMTSPELDKLGQIMFKQLKNRYGDPNINKRFVVGIERAKMKLTDALQTEQDGIIDAHNTPKQAPAKTLVVKNGGPFGPQRLFDEV